MPDSGQPHSSGAQMTAARRDAEADLDAVRAEAERLHVVIERWFAGSSTATEQDAELFAQGQEPDFSFISTDGGVVERQALLGGFADARGRAPGLRIRIEDVRLIAADREVVVATFLERHLDAPGAQSRRCTVVFRRTPDAPHGLRWLHLQETPTEG